MMVSAINKLTDQLSRVFDGLLTKPKEHLGCDSPRVPQGRDEPLSKEINLVSRNLFVQINLSHVKRLDVARQYDCITTNFEIC